MAVKGWAAGRRGRPPARRCGSCSSNQAPSPFVSGPAMGNCRHFADILPTTEQDKTGLQIQYGRVRVYWTGRPQIRRDRLVRWGSIPSLGTTRASQPAAVSLVPASW